MLAVSPVNTTARYLSLCPLFQGFSKTGLEIFGSVGIERVVPQGTPIFVENMVGGSLFVIAEGFVRICLRDSSGKDRPLAVLREGEHFGGLSLLTPGNNRLVSAIAETEARVIEIRHKDFVKLQGQKPQACLKLLLSIATELGRDLNESRETFRSLLLAGVRA